MLTRSLIDACCTQLIHVNAGGTGQKPTKFISDVTLSSLLLMRTYRLWYSNSFSDASTKNAGGISPPSLLSCFSQHYLVAIANSLDKVQINHLHLKRFRMVKILHKSVQYILRYSTKYASFFAISYQTFTKWALSPLELLDQIFTNFFYTI